MGSSNDGNHLTVERFRNINTSFGRAEIAGIHLNADDIRFFLGKVMTVLVVVEFFLSTIQDGHLMMILSQRSGKISQAEIGDNDRHFKTRRSNKKNFHPRSPFGEKARLSIVYLSFGKRSYHFFIKDDMRTVDMLSDGEKLFHLTGIRAYARITHY